MHKNMNLKIKTGESSKKNSLKIAFLLCFLISVQFVFAQNQTIDLNMTDKPLSEIFKSIEKQADISVDFDETQINIHQKISVNIKNKKLTEALSMILSPLKYKYAIQGKHVVITNEKNRQKSESIVGFVKNPNGEPLIGASVLVKGTNNAVSTDIDGRFHIKASPKSRLVVSYVGHDTQEIAVTPGITMNIELSEKANIMDEVVVVGYGTQKKANLIGAVGYTDHKQLERRPVNNLGQALQGAIPNLNISYGSGKPGEKTRMNVRGFASINQESKPLILIDGMEGNIDKINPRDVESISVLKDASSAAIYGARAPFGVVLITTKKGESGKTQVNYNGRFSFSKPTTRTDFLTTGYDAAMLVDEFMRSYNGVTYTRLTSDDYKELEARRFDKTENPERPWTVVQNRGGVESYMYYANFDWYHYLFKDEHPNTSHSVSLSGGNSKVKYMLSGNYYSEEGLFRQDPDRLQRINFRSKISFDINKWLKISNNTSYYNYQYYYPGPSGVNTAFSLGTVHGLASMMPYNPDGTSVYYTSLSKYSIMDGLPTIMNKGGHYNKDKTDNMSTTTELTWTPVKGLEIKGNFTYMFNTQHNLNRQVNTEYSQYPGEVQTLSTGSRFQDKLYEKTMMHNYYQANIYATYAHTWNEKHNFKAMAGFNWETKYLKDVSATGYNLLSETLMDLNLVGQGADGNERMEVGGGQNEYALMGFFGRLNYDYKGKYLVEVSGRYDGTSRFKRGHRWGFFPSLSLGWRISEEPFFEGIRKNFNNLKIRCSYGQLGNQNVGYYDYIRKISIGSQNYLFGGDKPTTATISAPVASNLSWETSIHNNLGVDMSFLNNRLAFSADFYIRDTKDMLTAGVALPSVYGADSPKMNSADLRTKGYELSLSWRDEFQLLRRPFTYSVTVTFNDYVTNITKYDNPDRTFAKSYYEGMRWGEIWGYRIGGLFATDAEAAGYAVDQTAVNNRINAAAGSERGLHAGDLKFLDLDGDNIISIGKNTVDDPGDREIIGNSQPRFHYGTTLSMSWAGIDFSIFFQGIGRRHWYPKANTIAFWGPYARPYASWIPKDFHKMYWSEENPDAYFPRPRGYVALSGTNRELTAVNDRYMQNIRYCRLKNLTIGYTLPKKWTRKVLIDNLRVYFTGENLATWSPIRSDYIDPEMAAMNDEMRTYPWQKTYMFGVDVTF